MRLSCGFIAFLLALLSSSSLYAEGDGPVVARLRVKGEKQRAEVSVEGSFKVPVYSIHTLNEGKQVVLELEGATLATRATEVEGSAALIVRSTASTSAKGVRVVLDLTHAAPYRTLTDAGRIRLLFEAAPVTAEAPPAASSELEIKHVIIERRNGRDRLVAELTRPAPFRVLPGSTGPARLEITGARVAQAAARHLEGDSASVIKRAELKEVAGRTIIEVERASGASTTALREGNRIVWLFAAEQTAENNGTRTRTVAREEAVEVDGEEVAAFLSDVPLQIGPARDKRKYTGRVIDLDLKNADIHNVLRLLSEVGNVNIITADDVVQPTPEAAEEFFVRVPVALAIRGRYHELAKFFYNISRLERAINMEDLNVSASERQTSGEVQLAVNVRATTFRRKE